MSIALVLVNGYDHGHITERLAEQILSQPVLDDHPYPVPFTKGVGEAILSKGQRRKGHAITPAETKGYGVGGRGYPR